MSYQHLPEAKARERATKFTPERIQQIKALVARGETREQIAAIIGVTVGSLQVTCSRLGKSAYDDRELSCCGRRQALRGRSARSARPQLSPSI